jgi:hypothetical protein
MQQRRFIRHPVEIPIEVRDEGAPELGELRMSNVSEGGLCFHSAHPFQPGAQVRVRIASVSPPFEGQAFVTWCREVRDGYEIGVRFPDSADAFRARMVEQVCHIEQYRSDVSRREGRTLDGQTAAREWIALHAADFPDAAPGGP